LADTAELTEPMREAIEACRRDKWAEGLPALARIAEETHGQAKLPSLVYSYLGYGIALRQQRYEDGIKLCQHAVRIAFYEPDGYLNLARTLFLAGKRRAAVRALEQGLGLVPDHEGLLAFRTEIGHRRTPVFKFLSRKNPINSLLGRIRHTFHS
jgi:tetratricopeptide (TPR) repeat protein